MTGSWIWDLMQQVLLIQGESILKPEDVQVGLNFNVISKEITDTETIIHELRIRENNILKILKKRAKKYE